MKNILIYFLYQQFLKENNLFKKIFYSKKTVYFNKVGWEANIKLDIPTGQNSSYNCFDASGTAFSKIKAINIAISEGLERYIYLKCIKEEELRFGFDKNSSTDGMAVMPRYFKQDAIEASYFEAVERWSLREWWKGHLDCIKVFTEKFYCVYQILVPFENVKVIILEHQTLCGQFAYGFAASCDLNDSIYAAEKELVRNLNLIKYKDLFTGKKNIQEERILFFSTKAGNDLFRSKVKIKTSSSAVEMPEIVFQGEVCGIVSPKIFCYRTVFVNKIPIGNSHDEFYF